MRGSGMLRLAHAWFDEATVTRIFEPLIADWQRECASLTSVRAAWCMVRGKLAFAFAFLTTFVSEPRSPLPAALSGSVWLGTEAFLILGMLVQYAVFIDNAWLRGNYALVLPSLAATALPLALVPMTILVASRRRWSAFEVRRACAGMALVSVLLLIPLAGWITPASNQRWRESAARSLGHASVLRGTRELTLFELAARTAPSDFMRDTRSRTTELYNRVGIMVMPFALTALALAASRCKRAVWHALFWWVASATIWMFLGGLAPHLIFLTIAAALVWRLPLREAALRPEVGPPRERPSA